MLHPKSSEEISRRGQILYDQKVRSEIADCEKGKFLVLNIETGEYEIDADELTALQRAKTKQNDAALYMLRIGHPAAYRLGKQSLDQ